MEKFENWANILAIINITIYFTNLIISISFGAYWWGLNTIFTIFSSIALFLKRIGPATAFQLFSCFFFGVPIFINFGVAMAFNGLTFWEVFIESPLYACVLISFLGFCGIAFSLLILEYKNYNDRKKYKNYVN